MTEDARPIPDHLARELRALNDLELGAAIADLGVDPLAPPGAKLRGALAAIAEDPHPWWEGTLAGHAVDRLAKEPRRGRIAGGGALDHARRTWHGLAGLGAAARLLLPDPDLAPLLDLRAALDRRLDPREGERAGVALDRLTAAVVDASPDRAAIGRLARDFGISAEPRALPGAVADALAGVKRERDNLRREVQQNRTRSAEVSAARRQSAEINDQLLDAREALGAWQAWADREAASAGYGAAAGDPGQCRRAISGALGALRSAQVDLSGWRSWAGLAGRLPPAELLGIRGDDGKLRAAVDVMLRIASGAEDAAAELAKSQRARKSLEGRFAAAHEEGRLEALAACKGTHDALAAVASELRAPKSADLAGMVRTIREAAGPTTLSGPGARAEHVARLRDLAGASAADLVGAVDAREALREIAAITSGG